MKNIHKSNKKKKVGNATVPAPVLMEEVEQKEPVPFVRDNSILTLSQIKTNGFSLSRELREHKKMNVTVTWELVNHSSPPAARWGHTMVVSSSKLVVFGGTGNRVYADTFFFDLCTNTWSEIKCSGNAPSARYGHACVPISSSKVFFFGGKGPTNKQFNDVFLLDTAKCTWKRWAANKSSPEGRIGHTLTLCSGGRLILFGGQAGKRKYLNSVYVYALRERRWIKEACEGPKPSPRGGHTAVVAGPNKLLIFGGYSGKKYLNDLWYFNTSDMTWKRVVPNGFEPPPRTGHIATVVGNYMLIFGGCSNSTFLRDVHIFNMQTHTWITPSGGSANALSARFRHAATLVGRGRCYVFGGSSAGVLYNDLGVITIPDLLSTSTGPQLSERDSGKELVESQTFETGESEGEGYNTDLSSSSEGSIHTRPLQGPSHLEVMHMYLSLIESYKVEKTQREQLQIELKSVEKVLSLQRKAYKKVTGQLAEREAELLLLQEKHQKVLNQKKAANLALSRERSKRERLKAKYALETGRDSTSLPSLSLSRSGSGLSQDSEEESKPHNGKDRDPSPESVRRQLNNYRSEIQFLRSQNKQLKNTVKQLNLTPPKPPEPDLLSLEVGDDLGLDQLSVMEESLHELLKKVANAKQQRLLQKLEEMQREKEMLESQKICVVCADKQIRIVLIPCGHRCLCVDCSKALDKCPMCRVEITQRIDTY
eukprot:CAMPEP_0174263518 /NCGR_PEP_ID=MMETSP0439-20130205/19021_1 /TAXON_ID=0 /ORGANISM="Stereomyxa ramosa, Strain Chinc5" /LENGTH=707 /DNA_ID=CAMNT_0015348907 /DNA_START=33 /DNA_END=2156 /DNA_ORIENTATION=-